MARPSVEFAKSHLGGVGAIVEVGVRSGINAKEMYETLRPAKMYLVDVYKTVDKDDPDSKWTEEQHRAWYEEAKELTKGMGAEFVIKRSQEAAVYVPDNLDFVYIDAAHTEFNVARDIACWFQKVRIGGILSGHDYAPGNAVWQAVHLFFRAVQTKEWDWWIVRTSKNSFG